MKRIAKKTGLLATALLTGAYFSLQAQTLQSDTASIKDLMNIQLDESQIRKNLDNTKVVSASKTKENENTAPGLMTVVSRQEIESFGGNSLVDVLNRVIGTYVAGSYYFPQNLVAMRGDLQTHTTSHVLILIDGRPCRESFYGGVDLAVLNGFSLDAIERIEIIRGPGSVLYGTNAFTGVVNILTKTEKKTTTKLSARAGSFGTWGLTGSQTIVTRDWQVQANGRYFSQAGWDFTATDQNGITRTVPYGQKNASVNLQASYGNWTFRSFYGNSDRSIFGERPLWKDDSYNRLRTYRAFADLGYKHTFTKYWYATTNLTYNGFSQRSVRDARFVHFFSNDALLETTHFVQIVPQLNATAGALLSYNTGAGRSTDAQDNPAPNIVEAYSETRWGAYTQLDYTPASFLKLIAGGQINKTPYLPADLVPRLGSIIQFRPGLGVKMLYGEAYKSAAQSEKYTLIPQVLYGNPYLKPERVRTAEAQLFFQKTSYNFSLGYFRSYQRNTVQRTAYLDNAATYANLGSMHSEGLELEGKILPVQQFTVTGSLAYQTNVNNLGQRNTTAISSWMAKGGVAYQAGKGLSVGLFHSFFSKPADVISAQSNLPEQKQRKLVNPVPQAFHLLSLNVSANANKLLNLKSATQFSFQCYAENLLNQSVYNPEFSRRNINSLPAMGGRAVYAGISVRL